jgi:hypothetical protein
LRRISGVSDPPFKKIDFPSNHSETVSSKHEDREEAFMATGKAYYWLALGALALGLGSDYQRGELQPLHRIANRSAVAANCLLVRAHQYVVMARFLTGKPPAADSLPKWNHAVATESSHSLAKLQADLAVRKADLARLGVERVQMINLGHEVAARQREFACMRAERARMVAMARAVRKTRRLEERTVHAAMSTDSDGDMADIEVADEN